MRELFVRALAALLVCCVVGLLWVGSDGLGGEGDRAQPSARARLERIAVETPQGQLPTPSEADVVEPHEAQLGDAEEGPVLAPAPALAQAAMEAWVVTGQVVVGDDAEPAANLPVQVHGFAREGECEVPGDLSTFQHCVDSLGHKPSSVLGRGRTDAAGAFAITVELEAERPSLVVIARDGRDGATGFGYPGHDPERRVASCGTIPIHALSGVVVRVQDTTGRPLAGARVTLKTNSYRNSSSSWRGSLVQLSGASGVVRFEHYAEEGAVTVEHAGFVPQHQWIDSWFSGAPAKPGADVQLLFELPPARSLDVLVVDGEGAPRPGLMVEVCTTRVALLGGEAEEAATSLQEEHPTDAEGRARFLRVDRGELEVKVTDASGAFLESRSVTSAPNDALRVVVERAGEVVVRLNQPAGMQDSWVEWLELQRQAATGWERVEVSKETSQVAPGQWVLRLRLLPSGVYRLHGRAGTLQRDVTFEVGPGQSTRASVDAAPWRTYTAELEFAAGTDPPRVLSVSFYDAGGSPCDPTIAFPASPQVSFRAPPGARAFRFGVYLPEFLPDRIPLDASGDLGSIRLSPVVPSLSIDLERR